LIDLAERPGKLNDMAIKEEMDWGKVIGALLASIILVCFWIACGKKIISVLNVDDLPKSEERRHQ
jgi:hypothetical protein